MEFDSTKYCYEYLRSQQENFGLDIQISNGEGYHLLPQFIKNRKTLVIPDFTEALVILDAANNKKEFVELLLAYHLLINDQYQRCSQIVSILEDYEGIDAEVHFESVLNKCLFMVFHELGHYLINQREDIKTTCFEYANLCINEFKEGGIDLEETLKQYMYKMYEVLPAWKEDFEQYESVIGSVAENGLTTVANKMVDWERKKEEYAADIFAFIEIDSYLSSVELLNNDNDIHRLQKDCLDVLYLIGAINGLNFKVNEGYQGKQTLKLTDSMSFDSLRDIVYGMFSELWMRHKYNLEIEIGEEDFVSMALKNPTYHAILTESFKLVEVISEAALTDYNKDEFCNLLKRLSEYIKKLKIRAYINN